MAKSPKFKYQISLADFLPSPPPEHPPEDGDELVNAYLEAADTGIDLIPSGEE